VSRLVTVRTPRPSLHWSEVPSGVVELALTLEDPDAPRGTFVHWVVWGIDPSSGRLASDGGAGIRHGRNGFGKSGYGGSVPPPGHGPHHYQFTLYRSDGTFRVGIVDLLANAERAVAIQEESARRGDRELDMATARSPPAPRPSRLRVGEFAKTMRASFRQTTGAAPSSPPQAFSRADGVVSGVFGVHLGVTARRLTQPMVTAWR
jgi:Raf kinase inhibitor-like YbhB/YbcL family protein